jgi:hypothetical protein
VYTPYVSVPDVTKAITLQMLVVFRCFVNCRTLTYLRRLVYGSCVAAAHLEPRPPEGFQELQKVGRLRKDVRRRVALRAVVYRAAHILYGDGDWECCYFVAVLMRVSLRFGQKHEIKHKRDINTTSTVDSISHSNDKLQRNVINPVLYPTTGDKRCVHGCMSGLPNTRTFTLPVPLVPFFASAAPLLSGSLAVVSRPVEGLGMPQRDVQSSGRDASWLLAKFTSCRDHGIPTAVQVSIGRCTES